MVIPQIAVYALSAVACLCFLYAIWIFVKFHWKIGKPWTDHKAATEELRTAIIKMEKSGIYTPEELKSPIESFNELAKGLRLPLYVGDKK